MSLRINAEAPNFTAQTTQGQIDFHNWIGNGWAILFSHPDDFVRYDLEMDRWLVVTRRAFEARRILFL